MSKPPQVIEQQSNYNVGIIINLNMSKGFKQNYLSKQNGCKVIEASSQDKGSLAQYILSDNIKEVWLVQKKLPQYCIIDTSNMRNYSKVYNRVGFYCWHEYESNPALIEIAYSYGDEEWTVVGKIRLELKSQRQYFKIKDIPTTEMKRLKVTLLQNFGDKSTYLNQIELGYVKEGNLMEQPSREKTYSDFMKLTSTEKELKRAQEQIKKLNYQNEQIKSTLKKQGEMILEMQNAFKMLTKEMQKLQRIQEVQGRGGEKSSSKEISKILERRVKGKMNFGTNSSESISSRGEKGYTEDKMMNKKTVSLLNKKNSSQSYAKSNLNSNKRSREVQDMRASKGATIRQSKNQALPRRETESELSEYLVSEHEDEKSKYSEKCSQMMVKLQFLLAERERRQNQLMKKNQR